ncbi:glycosyltransferase family 4 protein [Candidatus Uhrbacteria bacterium]|nr:glycosyltransferase family 4 protein [Candidatus Uhrbacteria bacterium]
MTPILLLTLEYPPQIGGIATYLSRLAGCFPEGTIQVMAQKPPRELEIETHKADMESPIPIYRRSLLSDWVRPRWFSGIFHTERFGRKAGFPPAVIVSHLLPMGLPAWRLKRLRGIPYCVILHGMDAALALKSRGLKRRQASAVLRGADLVVVNSRLTAGLAGSLGADRSKTMIIHPPSGFPVDYRPSEGAVARLRERFGLSDRILTVMSAGRLVRRKGFDDVIIALSKLASKGVGFRYLVVGEGPDRLRLERLANERGIGGQTVFAGVLPPEDLAAAYSSADLFVMVPKSNGPDIEGFGIVYLEANLFGKPVIGTRSGGVPDAVIHGETGLLVNPGRPDELASAIGRFVFDRGLGERLGQAGRERVIREFDWNEQFRPLVKAMLNISAR